MQFQQNEKLQNTLAKFYFITTILCICQFVQIVILNSRMRIENIEFAQTVITLEKKMKSLMLMN